MTVPLLEESSLDDKMADLLQSRCSETEKREGIVSHNLSDFLLSIIGPLRILRLCRRVVLAPVPVLLTLMPLSVSGIRYNALIVRKKTLTDL